MPTLLSSIVVAISVITVSIAGLFGFTYKSQVEDLNIKISQLEEQANLGAYYPVAGDKYYLSGSGVSATDVTVVLRSFKKPVSAEEYSMSLFGTVGYATLDPGTSKKEFVSFTGITQDAASDKATLTGVTRGLEFNYPFTASSSLASSHSGGSILILSNSPQLYEQYANKSNSQTITGLWTFASSTIPRQDFYLAPTANYQFAPKGYVDSVATSGAANAASNTAGLVEISTLDELNIGTTIGSTGAILVVPNNYISSSSAATTTIPLTGLTGKLSTGFIDQTETYTWSGTNTFSGATTTFSGRLSMGSTTINKVLTVNGTSTFASTTKFLVIPTLPADDPASANQAARAGYVDYYRYLASSSNLKASSDAEKTTIATNWTLLKSIKVYYSGTIKALFDIKSDSGTAKGVIWIGNATDTVATTSSAGGNEAETSATFNTHTWQLNVSAGDYVQLYGLSNSAAATTTVRNFRLYWDLATSSTGYLNILN